MKVPQEPPPFDRRAMSNALERAMQSPDLMPVVSESQQWLHWDDLRRRPPPPGLDHATWWHLTKLIRSGHARRLPFAAVGGQAITWNLTDAILDACSRFDQGCATLAGRYAGLLNERSEKAWTTSSLQEEAIHSSLLEGAATTRLQAKALLRTGRPPIGKGERMVLNGWTAMNYVHRESAGSLTPHHVIALQSILTTDTLDDPTAAGRLRVATEDIAVRTPEGEVLHTPPPAAELAERLDRLCAFVNQTTGDGGWLHPLVRGILAHFQLAYDHPFVDGNGRTARALFYWTLLHHGVPVVAYLPISKRLYAAPAKYARAFLLTETDGFDTTYFVHHQVEVVVGALEDFRTWLDREERELRRTEKLLRLEGRVNHRQLALIRHALAHPGAEYTLAGHQRHHGVSYPTSREDLLDLERRGVMRHFKRSRALVFVPVDDLTDAFRRLPTKG